MMKALSRELMQLQAQPEEGIVVAIDEANLSEVAADISGPEGTPYFGGTFRVRLCCSESYPGTPPAGKLLGLAEAYMFHRPAYCAHAAVQPCQLSHARQLAFCIHIVCHATFFPPPHTNP
jgi:hypothetical protein